MKTINCSAGQVIFRQGELADTMFEIRTGSVGIYTDYKTALEKQIAVLNEGQFLGELGMIEGCPRTASAVAMEDGTVLTELAEEDIAIYFRNRPEQVVRIMRQLSARIREIDESFYDACKALKESEEASRSGTEKSPDLNRKLQEISREADRQDSFTSLRSSFFQYVLDDLAEYGDKNQIVKASLLEKLFVHFADPDRLHVNPDDEFAMLSVGPSERIIQDYVKMIPMLRRGDQDIFPEPVLVSKLKSDGYMIINGHHRWAAALKTGVDKLRIKIVNPEDSGGF